MQPKEGQPGHKTYATAYREAWGIKHLEDGCLASGVCPVGSWTSPISQTERLIRIQNVGISLVTSADINRLRAEVDLALSNVQTSLGRAKTRFSDLANAVAAAGTYIKGQIRAILESTGGPTALRSAGLSVGALLGPIGAAVGLLLSEAAISAAVSTLWTKVSEGPTKSKNKAGRIKTGFMVVKPTIRNAFRWWKTNTTSSWRSARKAQLIAAKGSLEGWVGEYDAMEPRIQLIYPRRSAAEWIRLGVDASCTERGPDFELPGGWKPIGGHLDPKGGATGTEDDEFGWDSGAAKVETEYGSLVYDRGRKPKPSLRTWLILGGLVGVTYYYMQKEQR
jgi:hypothetical protein